MSKAFATGLLLAATVSIASAAEGSFSGGDAESCEEKFGKDFCHGEGPRDRHRQLTTAPLIGFPRCPLTVLLRDAELGPLAALYASAVVVFVILGILCLLVPCIVFGVAWCGPARITALRDTPIQPSLDCPRVLRRPRTILR